MDNNLQNLGFSAYFESLRKKLQIGVDLVARVIAEHRGMYYVKNSRSEFQARITGKQMFRAGLREDYPAVGDWVVITIIDKDRATIEQILPRRTIIRNTAVSRKSTDMTKSQIIATNVDIAFVVESVDRDYSLNRFERYFALLEDGNVKPAIILNKVDLISNNELDSKIAEIKERFTNCTVIPTSTKTSEGLDRLRDSLSFGKTYCFLGSSGVGKSSLVNSLIGENKAKIGAISQKNERGKHVTTHREMYFLENGGVVIDNPGMREVGLVNSEIGVRAIFGEIEYSASLCKFADCSHTHEAGCAVLQAVESGMFSQDRYNNYIRLKKEAKHYEMTEHEERDKDKKFGKYVKNYLKRMKEFE